MLNRFVQVISSSKDVEAIYLFGSRARGEGNIESDIDIAVVVKNRQMIQNLRQRVIETSINIEEEQDICGELMLSPVVIEESLLEGNYGIGKRIRREGVLLWSKRLKREKEKAI